MFGLASHLASSPSAILLEHAQYYLQLVARLLLGTAIAALPYQNLTELRAAASQNY